MASKPRLQEKPKPAKRDEPLVRERYAYVAGLTLNPDPGVDYSRVLSGPGQRAATSVSGIAAAVLSYFFVYPLVMQLILLIGYVVRGRPTGVFLQYTKAAVAFEYPEGLLASHMGLASLIIVTMLLMKYAHQRDGKWLSSVQPGLRWRYLILCLGISLIVMNAMYWVSAGRFEFVWNPQSDAVVWIALIVVTTPLQAAGEEYFFRGYLTQVVGSLIKWKWVSILASSLLFALAHGIDLQNIPLFVTRFAFGLLMGVLIVYTGGLEAAIAAHVANNVSTFTYAALNGDVAGARAITEATWEAAAWNIGAYAVTGVLCWLLGNKLRVAKYTPAL